VALRDHTLQGGEEGGEETAEPTDDVDVEAAAAKSDEDAAPAQETSTDEGYDEAVEAGVPFSAEAEILAQDSADPVALSEAEPFSEADLVLQEAGRDLRPDTIVPAPDLTSSEVQAIESLDGFEEFAAADNASEDETSAPADSEVAADSESSEEEKQDASPDAAN
jgi:hypothetical protein